MRLIAACMASNEADIIEAYVRHNAAFLDAMVVLDHGSVDATARILAQLVQEGLPVIMLRDPDRGYHQSQRMTWLARRYLAELDADFCFTIDADEFIKAPSRAVVESALAAIPAGHAGAMPLQNYVGADAAIIDPNPVRRLTRRMRAERAQTHKVVVPRSFAAAEDLHVATGNHSVVRVSEGKAQPIGHTRLEAIALGHFPVRSPEQVARKALLGWLSHRVAMPANATVNLMSHWRGLFEGIVAGTIAIDEGLVRRAVALYVGAAPGGTAVDVTDAELVADPVPAAYELRYTPAESPAPVAVLAAWADQLVTDLKSGSLH